jgi:glycosidase
LAQPGCTLALVVAAAAAGCSAPPAARCPLTVWYRPARLAASLLASAPELIGSWDGWARPGVRAFASVRADDGTEWRSATVHLAPGVYQYAIAFADARIVDELNPRTAFVAGAAAPLANEVSEVVLADCNAATLTPVTARADGDALVFAADFAPGADGVGLARALPAASLTQAGATVAAPVTVERSDGPDGRARLTARAPGLLPGKYTLTLSARDRAGRVLAATGSAFIATPTNPATLGDTLVYQILIDRFRGPAGALAPPSTPGERAGGTLDGVRAAIEAGYFDALGVTTLWLSPVYTNPSAHELGRDGHPVVPYHGYWPAAPRTVDPQLGGDAALDAVVAAAHARGLRVILDVVPNHVFAAHPYVATHARTAPGIVAAPRPDADLGTISWFNDGPDACVCGDPGCDWATHMETCWFASYLPDLNWRHPDVMRAGVDDITFWMSRFDLDGLRIDAVPMMPRAATRRLMHAVGAMALRPAGDLLVVGEVYTGPGAEGRAQIGHYLGAELDGLQSAFDFPLMWALRDAIAHDGSGGFVAVEDALAAGARAWAGSGATMAHIIGNHDTTRFVSEANGDAGGDPWTQPPAQPHRDEPYQRQWIALALLLTQPGIPVLYYGDEVGLAGGSDPDSRRVLPDAASLSSAQQRLYEAVAALGRARRCAPALRGERTVALVDAYHDVALLQAPSGERALVVLSRAATATTLDVAGVPAGAWQDVVSPARVVSDGAHAAVVAAPMAAAVYLPEGSRCLR